MGARTGNPVWVDSTDSADAAANPSRKITAAKLNAIESALDDSAEATHVHAASQTTSGVFAAARLGTGTADSGTVLHGDGTWKPAPSGGGSTLTATDAPTAPAEGTSASYLVSSAVTWPAGLVWSTDPDGGEEPVIDDYALVSLFTLGGLTRAVMGATFPAVAAPEDTTGPTAGTLGVVVGVTSADGTVTGAEDETGLDAAPYSFRIDAGTYSAWQAGNTFEWTGLDPDTEYDFQHRVRDAAGNVTEGAVVTDSTDADTTGPTAGTLSVDPGVTTADLSVSGASDDIALHATPYAFSTDNGSTWSAYQAGATYEATGLTADTSYTFRHRVRDAAGNVTVGTAVVDSTDPVPADTTPPTPGTLAASAITSDSFTLTVTGASDDVALHGTPYRFSTDNGVSYSAWQAGATFNATGLDAETEYDCVHQVRDAALNVAAGSSIAVETSSPLLSLSDAILALNPVGYWKLDETSGTTAADSSGYARHGTYSGDFTLAAGSFATFGSTGVVTIPDHDDFTAAGSTNGFSVFGLAYRTSTGSSQGALVSKHNGTSLTEWSLEVDIANKVLSYVMAGTTYLNAELSSTAKVAMSDWHAVATTMPEPVAGLRAKHYVDNSTPEVSTSIASGTPDLVNTTQPVTIGMRGDASRSFIGKLGHVAIFRKELSAAEVGTLMAAAASEGLI